MVIMDPIFCKLAHLRYIENILLYGAPFFPVKSYRRVSVVYRFFQDALESRIKYCKCLDSNGNISFYEHS